MKIFYNAVLCLTLLLSAKNLKAQNRDYVITNSGDTIKCTIAGPSLLKVYKYKTSDNGEFIKIKEQNIRDFYLGDKNILMRFVYIEDDAMANLMKVIENGRISLYEVVIDHIRTNSLNNGTFDVSNTEWFVSKESDTVSLLKYNGTADLKGLKGRKQRKDDFKKMIEDNKEVYNKYIASKDFSFEQLRGLVHSYNSAFSKIAQPFKIRQKDYVIKRNKDTVFSEIEPASFNSVGRYRPYADNKFTRIDTTISEYFLASNSSTYLLKTLPKNRHPEYVKLIVKGYINLYSHSTYNVDNDKDASLYASKGKGDLVQIKRSFTSHFDKDEKKALIDLFSDDPNMSGNIETLPCDFTSILNLVKTYNGDYLKNNKPLK